MIECLAFSTATQRIAAGAVAWLQARLKGAFDVADPFLVAFVERPLLDSLPTNQARLCEDTKMLARGWLVDAKLPCDEQAAYAVLDEIAVNWWPEVGSRVFQPTQDLQSPLVAIAAP